MLLCLLPLWGVGALLYAGPGAGCSRVVLAQVARTPPAGGSSVSVPACRFATPDCIVVGTGLVLTRVHPEASAQDVVNPPGQHGCIVWMEAGHRELLRREDKPPLEEAV